MVTESATHTTEWRRETRNGDVDGFIRDRHAEAIRVLNGGRESGLLGTRGFMREIDLVDNWIANGLPESERKLWTPDRRADAALQRLFLSDVKPEEVVEVTGNILVTAGIASLLNLLTGAGDTAFSNANAYTGVGDSTTGSSVGQTDLQAATNKLRKAMNATYPALSAPTIQFQSTFGSSEGNYVWNEVGIFNAAAAGTMLNRAVQSLGTKTSGSSWSLTTTLQFA